jgi:nucleoside-diphosphate kinase
MEDRYVFLVEWFDNLSSLVNKLRLSYYLSDGSVELLNLKTRKLFLKKTKIPDLKLSDFFIGGVITIFSRKLNIVDYADDFTRSNFEVQNQKTFAMIKPDAVCKIGQIIKKIENAGFLISRLCMKRFTLKNAQEFYKEHTGKPFFEGLTSFMSSGPVIGMELIGEDMIKKWRLFIGPTNCQVARAEAPDSIRALFGKEGVRNAVHGSDSVGSAEREIDIFFNHVSLDTSFLDKKITCGIIKPHVFKEKKVGDVLEVLVEKLTNIGMKIVAAQIFQIEISVSKEFLEVYKDVVPEYNSMVSELCDGKILVLAIEGENLVVSALRKIVGPHDPQIAKSLRNNTIRAIFGRDKIKNSFHCTDLEEDGNLECEYFFSILQ